MPKYLPYDYRQSSMVVINYEDQLQPGTFEYAVHYLIDNKIDLSVFHPEYRNDDGGRPAYDPAILLKIILFAYSKGITSSREIQWCCETNVLFKALSCDTVPHFTTIAHFVSAHPDQIEAIFEQVLLVCDQEGLLGNELFAIDGCKMSSNAAKEWSGTFKELEAKRQKLKHRIRQQLKAHRELDKKDPESRERVKRSRQTINALSQAHDKIEAFLHSGKKRLGQGRRPKEVKSNLTDNDSAKMATSKGTLQGFNGVAAVDQRHQIIIDAQAFGEGQEHHTLKPVLEAIQDRYRRLGLDKDIYRRGTVVTADTGFANEVNMRYLHDKGIDGYVPDNQFRRRDPRFSEQKVKYGQRHPTPKHAKKTKVIAASEFDFDPVAKSCRCPGGHELSYRGQRKDQAGNEKVFFEGRLLHCRHCELKHRCMQNPDSANHRKGNGRQVSFMVEHRTQNRYTEWMKGRIDSERGRQIYGQRMAVVEPVFANIGINKRLNRFSLRGKEKVQGQWRLYCLVHNIEKLANYGRLGN